MAVGPMVVVSGPGVMVMVVAGPMVVVSGPGVMVMVVAVPGVMVSGPMVVMAGPGVMVVMAGRGIAQKEVHLSGFPDCRARPGGLSRHRHGDDETGSRQCAGGESLLEHERSLRV
ncbi:hypothetical protein [Streptosporangium sp. G12]